MAENVVVVKDHGDGTFLGASEEGLFDGVLEQVGFDALEVVTTLTETGFERVSSYKGIVHSKGTMNRATFDRDRIRERRNMQEDYPEKDYPDYTTEELDSLWQAEVDIGGHDKAWLQLPDGQVEKLLSFLVWTPREVK